MSKYIDLMLALNKLWKLCVEDIDAEISESETFDFGRARDALSDLPSIEVSEVCISREWLIDEIARRDTSDGYVKTFGGREINEIILNAPSVIPQVPNEGAISRAYIDREIAEVIDELDRETALTIGEMIHSAPPVIPQPKEGEWKWETNDICHNCGYKIPHLERIVGETVLMDSKDWNFCPNCGSRR